jgi:hypothetical protein
MKVCHTLNDLLSRLGTLLAEFDTRKEEAIMSAFATSNVQNTVHCFPGVADGLHRPLSCADVFADSELHRGSGGCSEENADLGFRPAFLDAETRIVYRSCFLDGSPASVHLLDGLPDEVVVSRTESGRVTAVKGSLVSGFVRFAKFYTRDEAAAAVRASAQEFE